MSSQQKKVRPEKYDERKITRRPYSAQSYHLFRCNHVERAIERGDSVFTPTETHIDWHGISLCSRCEWIAENEDRFEEIKDE